MRKNTKPHWQIIQPVKKGIYIAMAFAVSSVLLILSAVYTLVNIIQTYLESGHVNWGKFIVLLILTFSAFVLRGISFKRSHFCAFSLEPILRRQLTAHLAKVSLGTLNEQGNTALAKIILDDVRDLHIFVADSTPLYARAYASPLFTFVFLLFIDWRLAIVALGVLATGMIILNLAMRDSLSLTQQYNQAREDVSRSVVEFVQEMPIVRTFDGGQTSFGRYERALDNYLNILVKWYRRSGIAAKLSMILLNPMPTLIALLWVGTYLLWKDDLTFSTWLAILLLGTGMAESLIPFMGLYHMVEKAKMSIIRIQQILALPILPSCSKPQIPKDASITFEQVDFCYQNRSKNALTNVSFNIPAGSFTALVGASGAGKSTVARLIPRFWDVDAGSVKIGGIDVRDISPDVLMNHVAFVFQDTFLFSGTIAENILLGQKDKKIEAVIEACKQAQAHHFISQLPDGYNTQVGERGANLSGGQRQRITVARAILQNRPIVILDEATAFADAENEALMMKAIHALMQNKTVLMITHRLTSIQNADQILAFDDGKLIESGKADKLATQNGTYANLWKTYKQAQSWTIQLEKS